MPWAAAAAAVGSIGAAVIGSSSSKSAADKASASANQAAQLQQQRYDQTRADLMPYNESGQNALSQMQGLYDETGNKLNAAYDAAQAQIPHSFTQAQLLNNPGYQFQVREGQKALANSLGSRGFSGLSGTQAKAAMNFGTGLASSNWQQLFGNQQQTFGDYSTQLANRNAIQNSLFSQLSNRATIGENAAAQTGAMGASLATQQGNNVANAGAYQAAADLRSGNALASGFVGAGQAAKSALSGTDVFSGNGLFSANSLNGAFGTQFGDGTFPSSSNPYATVPGYASDNYTPL